MGGSSGGSSRKKHSATKQGNTGELGIGGLGAAFIDDPCAIVRPTTLQGVRATALANVLVGMNLSVSLIAEGSVRSVVCMLPGSREIVGSITFKGITALIDCIGAGNQYLASVEDLNGGRCDVTIHRI